MLRTAIIVTCKELRSFLVISGKLQQQLNSIIFDVFIRIIANAANDKLQHPV